MKIQIRVAPLGGMVFPAKLRIAIGRIVKESLLDPVQVAQSWASEVVFAGYLKFPGSPKQRIWDAVRAVTDLEFNVLVAVLGGELPALSPHCTPCEVVAEQIPKTDNWRVAIRQTGCGVGSEMLFGPYKSRTAAHVASKLQDAVCFALLADFAGQEGNG